MGESVSGECSSNKVPTELTLRLLRREPTMTRKVIFGIAAVLAVVVVAAVVAVLVSGKTEDEVQMPSTNLTKDFNNDESIALENTGPPREVFMQTNNSFHGGVVIMVDNEFQKVVGYDIIGKDAVGENKTLQMETLAGASVSKDVLTLGETSYERYASRLGAATTSGWFDDAAEGGKLGNSMGVLAFSYQGAIFVGEKLIGDTFVPAGEESTRVNTTDGTAEVKWAFPGYKNPNWKPSKLEVEDEMDEQGHFTIITTHNNREYFTEFVPLDKMVEVDAGVAVRFAHPPQPLEKEGP